MQQVLFQDLGFKPYKEVWDYQESLLKEMVDIKIKNRDMPASQSHIALQQHLLFVEHPPVYTLGKNGNEENILISEQELFQKSIEYFHINRGGDITFHGPEQLVGYPILDLDSFKLSEAKLEQPEPITRAPFEANYSKKTSQTVANIRKTEYTPIEIILSSIPTHIWQPQRWHLSS